MQLGEDEDFEVRNNKIKTSNSARPVSTSEFTPFSAHLPN